MADTHTRQAKRTPVTLKIKFKSATLDQFIERYSVDVSHGGIFIRTKDPLPVGTALRFEFQLKDASPLITGEGTVVWTREHDPSRTGVAPGMGVRFDRLADGSQEVLDKILSHKAARGQKGKAPVFNETPTRVAPSPLVAGLAKESGKKLGNMAPPRQSFGDERTDATPLPSPMPFHSDAEDFPDEAFEEATKVRSLDELVKASASDEASMKAGEADAAPAPAANTGDTAAPGADAGDAAKAKAKADAITDELAARRAAKAAADESAAAQARVAEERLAAEERKRAEEEAAAAKKKRAAGKTAAPAAKKKPAKTAPARESKPEQKEPAAERREKAEPRKAATAAPEPASSGGGAKVALVALLFLVVAGGGYFAYTKMNENKEPETAANEPSVADDTAAPDETTDPDESAIPEEPEEPAPEVALVSAVVDATPEGATAALVDGDESGPVPFTFEELEEGEEYSVEISHPGFVSQTISFVAGEEPETIALAPMQRVLRVATTPPGALVYVNGQRQRGVTPMDVAVEGRLAKAARYRISLRLKGHKKQNLVATRDGEWAAEGDKLVHDVSVTLKERAVAVRDPVRNPPRDNGDGGNGNNGNNANANNANANDANAGGGGDEGGGDEGGGDEGAGDGGGQTGGGDADAGKDTAKDPVEDPAEDPAKDPAKDSPKNPPENDPAKDPETGPTPDWMK